MKLLLEDIKQKAVEEIKEVLEVSKLKDLKVKYLGKKGEITNMFLQKKDHLLVK